MIRLSRRDLRSKPTTWKSSRVFGLQCLRFRFPNHSFLLVQRLEENQHLAREWLLCWSEKNISPNPSKRIQHGSSRQTAARRMLETWPQSTCWKNFDHFFVTRTHFNWYKYKHINQTWAIWLGHLFLLSVVNQSILRLEILGRRIDKGMKTWGIMILMVGVSISLVTRCIHNHTCQPIIPAFHCPKGSPAVFEMASCTLSARTCGVM